MRVIVVGLGIQGQKRLRFAGTDALYTVDPFKEGAHYKKVEEVPLSDYDAALVCTPDEAKFEILKYLLQHKKHVLVEKPVLFESEQEIQELMELARKNQVNCYTAYNHRFEPHIKTLKMALQEGDLGKIYQVRFFYGNGTARDVRNSAWRDQGMGVLGDLGSHLLDTYLFLFGKEDYPQEGKFELLSAHRFENRAFDHVTFAAKAEPYIHFEMSLLSWKNTFHLDIIAEKGSAHIDRLCKWGPSSLILRKRILPSGKPLEEVVTLECPDPTWEEEYQYFKTAVPGSITNLKNDLWIGRTLKLLFEQGQKRSES